MFLERQGMEPDCDALVRERLRLDPAPIAGSNVRRPKKNCQVKSAQLAGAPIFQSFIADYHIHSKRIFECAYRVLQDHADAEDAVQEVFLRVQKHADQFSGKSQLSTWLYRIAFNVALECLRRRRRHKECGDAVLERRPTRERRRTEAAVDWLHVSDVEGDVYRGELRCAVKATLDHLRPMDRRVVYLSEAEDRSDREIAQLLGLTVSAVKTRLYRSRIALRAELASKVGYVSW